MHYAIFVCELCALSFPVLDGCALADRGKRKIGMQQRAIWDFANFCETNNVNVWHLCVVVHFSLLNFSLPVVFGAKILFDDAFKWNVKINFGMKEREREEESLDVICLRSLYAYTQMVDMFAPVCYGGLWFEQQSENINKVQCFSLIPVNAICEMFTYRLFTRIILMHPLSYSLFFCHLHQQIVMYV